MQVDGDKRIVVTTTPDLKDLQINRITGAAT